jgi:sorting nexin-7/30/sorting nexin-8
MESENIDQEIQAKQQLLQNEIIEKNYDKGSFINFCLSKRENGDDLNNWTLSELEAIVKEFVSTQNVQSVSQEQKNPEGEEINKENLEKMEKFNAEEPKNFKEKVIECRKLEKSELNDKQISITVKNPKEMDGGIFGKNYILYEVQTEPLGWVVTRRYSDFDTLRFLLAKYFPSYNIPPLPNKKMTNRRFEPDFILKRMKFLNLFINNVVQSEDFKAS